MSNIEVFFLKTKKHKKQIFFVNIWVYFQENILYFDIQGIPLQTVKSNLALREGRKDISDILWHFFSRKHMPILISELVFIKKKWEIMKNRNNC